MKNNVLDNTDRAILSLLQQNAETPVADIAEKVGLTVTPCWRRIQKLEEKGIISRRVALLQARLLGLTMTVFVQVKAGKHDGKWLAAFAKHAASFDEVVECYRMSGEYDYLLKVLVTDMDCFDHFYKRLVNGVEFSDVTSSFAMEQIKYTTAVPLNHL
ncbi:ArsR family transcriptional regulator [Alteromonas sp. KC3]|uniref:Lrp/AsnC family transcriptional regulator n=1 Tax=unclassified Alteromonas TaxID=2614992 RepID=UPI0019244D45|nr:MULTISPECIES: Lrp/AsnC family transcriptional regulator [unclassified Alteromonas]BCO20612.1 ArsR family transcriptional regulator [Alteromonas sp. KC3]BCO24581.1 ArsR family transcriptional regulator [Alteromonas sp. KC14]